MKTPKKYAARESGLIVPENLVHAKVKPAPKRARKPKAVPPPPVAEASASVEAPPVAPRVVGAVELVKVAPISTNRAAWAMRGDKNFAGDDLLCVEVAPNGWNEAAQTLDDYATQYGRPIVEVQRVQRKNQRALYGRLAANG